MITERLMLALIAGGRPPGEHGEVFFPRLPHLRPAVAFVRHELQLWLRSRGVGVQDAAVRDFGRWRPSRRDDVTRGRGLKMMCALMGRVEVERATAGTTVVVRRSLAH